MGRKKQPEKPLFKAGERRDAAQHMIGLPGTARYYTFRCGTEVCLIYSLPDGRVICVPPAWTTTKVRVKGVLQEKRVKFTEEHMTDSFKATLHQAIDDMEIAPIATAKILGKKQKKVYENFMPESYLPVVAETLLEMGVDISDPASGWGDIDSPIAAKKYEEYEDAAVEDPPYGDDEDATSEAVQAEATAEESAGPSPSRTSPARSAERARSRSTLPAALPSANIIDLPCDAMPPPKRGRVVPIADSHSTSAWTRPHASYAAEEASERRVPYVPPPSAFLQRMSHHEASTPKSLFDLPPSPYIHGGGVDDQSGHDFYGPGASLRVAQPFSTRSPRQFERKAAMVASPSHLPYSYPPYHGASAHRRSMYDLPEEDVVTPRTDPGYMTASASPLANPQAWYASQMAVATMLQRSKPSGSYTTHASSTSPYPHHYGQAASTFESGARDVQLSTSTDTMGYSSVNNESEEVCDLVR
jgi:hypothetical protein